MTRILQFLFGTFAILGAGALVLQSYLATQNGQPADYPFIRIGLLTLAGLGLLYRGATAGKDPVEEEEPTR